VRASGLKWLARTSCRFGKQDPESLVVINQFVNQVIIIGKRLDSDEPVIRQLDDQRLAGF
jgi:hypothetical protein